MAADTGAGKAARHKVMPSTRTLASLAKATGTTPKISFGPPEHQQPHPAPA
jgi:hypothetical protein